MSSLLPTTSNRICYASSQLHDIRLSYTTRVYKNLRNFLFINKIWKPKSNARTPIKSNTPKITIPLNFASLNTRSAVHKSALIHDVIFEHSIDMLCLTETRIADDAPEVIKLDVAPPGYSVIHKHRGSYKDKKGGGLALIHFNHIDCEIISSPSYIEMEHLVVKVTNTAIPLLIVIISCPPQSRVSNFF